LAAAMPFIVGVVWELIHTYQARKAMPGWIVDSALPYPVQFLVPVGFFGFVLFALVHVSIVLYRKLSN
jgi:hypothetical protein